MTPCNSVKLRVVAAYAGSRTFDVDRDGLTPKGLHSIAQGKCNATLGIALTRGTTLKGLYKNNRITKRFYRTLSGFIVLLYQSQGDTLGY